MAAAVASHGDAACARARAIGHLCGRTENDRNSNDYSRSKKGEPPPFPSPCLCPFLSRARDRPASGRGEFPAPLPDHARTARNESEIDALSIEGFPWD